MVTLSVQSVVAVAVVVVVDGLTVQRIDLLGGWTRRVESRALVQKLKQMNDTLLHSHTYHSLSTTCPRSGTMAREEEEQLGVGEEEGAVEEEAVAEAHMAVPNCRLSCSMKFTREKVSMSFCEAIYV